METLLTLVSLLIALSVASERLVEIVKGPFKFLNEINVDDGKERWRKVIIQLMALAAGVATALLAQPAIAEIMPGHWQSLPGLLALGLLASGGSGFWNSILAYLLQVKNIKKADAEAKKMRVDTIKKLDAEAKKKWAIDVAVGPWPGA